jgi:hypothetical protein
MSWSQWKRRLEVMSPWNFRNNLPPPLRRYFTLAHLFYSLFLCFIFYSVAFVFVHLKAEAFFYFIA